MTPYDAMLIGLGAVAGGWLGSVLGSMHGYRQARRAYENFEDLPSLELEWDEIDLDPRTGVPCAQPTPTPGGQHGEEGTEGHEGKAQTQEGRGRQEGQDAADAADGRGRRILSTDAG